jgi:anaerobic magnesium-protoporphyrin IX monomethyl ester cyclase
MADVLLTHSNHLFYDRKQTEKMQPYPPLQTLLAAAVLRQAGISVELCDVTLESPEAKFEALLDRFRPRLVVVCEDDFNFLSKMCLGRNRELAFWMTRTARERGIPTAAHGSDASDHAAEYLQAGFDHVMIGEVEATLLDLAKGVSIGQIEGLAYRRRANGEVVYNRPRRLRTDLDTLPGPAWDLVDIERYRSAWMRAHGYFALNMVSSRGCPYRCNWCAKPIWGNNYHVRSPRMVAQEMLRLKREYRPDRVWFADDIFALSGRWTEEFAQATAELGARIPFKMQSRCDLMTRDTAGALARAGCYEVWMGAESGSQRILDAMEKGIRVEDIHQARENLRRHGIRACFFVQFGYPGETWAQIEETIRMIRAAKPDDIGVSVTYPLPGTKLYQMVAAQVGAKANWVDSSELAMMFRGTYSTGFYRALADALHLEVRQPANVNAIRAAWDHVYALEGSVPRTNRAAS